MKRQTEIEKLFFELMQVVVWKRDSLSCRPTAKCWQQLFDIATRQSLVGVCFVGVQRLCDSDAEDYYGMSELQYLTWMGMAAKIQQRNEVVNRQCVEVQRMIAEKGYRSCIIKGQSNHPAYGSLAMLRQPGDIDIWIEGGRERVVRLVQSISPTKEIRETHAQLNVFDDTELEAHYRPGLIRDAFRNKKLQAFFESCGEDCFNNKLKLQGDKLEICAPTTKFNLVHQMLHIYHHLFDGGIGLRQVMDYYFVLCQLHTNERDGVMNTLQELGVARFTAALMYVQHEVFGLDRDLMLCEPNEQDGKFLLDEIMQSGNFGHYDERNKKFDMGSYYQNFFGIIGRNLAYFRFAPWDWLMSPLWRVYHFVWRKRNGYE